MTVFFTSDTHFNHKAIIGFTNRPFISVSEMNEVLAERWNSVVKPEDTVFHLGDIGLLNKGQFEAMMSRLNGRKFLIRGNHDILTDKQYLDLGFSEVYDEFIYKDIYVLKHRPPEFFRPGDFYVFGHVHNCPLYRTRTEQSLCVCVERWDYTPVNESELKL